MATRVPALIQLSDPRVAAQLVQYYNNQTPNPVGVVQHVQLRLRANPKLTRTYLHNHSNTTIQRPYSNTPKFSTSYCTKLTNQLINYHKPHSVSLIVFKATPPPRRMRTPSNTPALAQEWAVWSKST